MTIQSDRLRASLLSAPRAFGPRVARSIRAGRLSPRRLYLDPLRSTARSAIVLGTARSGTTKLAELLCDGGRRRLVFEPLNTYCSPIVPRDFVWGEYLPPGADDPELRDIWERVLLGKVRHPWLDRANTARIARGRIVKSIAATNLAPWLRVTFPDVPVAYIVRHPFAIAASMVWLEQSERARRARGDWDQQITSLVTDLVEHAGLLDGPLAEFAEQARSFEATSRDPFARLVLRWCLENFVALTGERAGVHLVHYEHLFLDPKAELSRIARGLETQPGRWDPDDLDRPSATDERRIGPTNRSVEHRICGWLDEVDEQQLESGLSVLQTFGLDRIYNEDPMPHQGVSG